MEQISYKLEVFEGPMDLLLHLISKHKLNIYDIPIIELVEQYIAYVKQMQDSDMYVASEFLEMAARLVYIKTVSLLPVYEEAEDLKKELTGELLEYRDCQLMAGKLAQRTKIVSVESKIKSIFKKLGKRGEKHRFHALFADAQSRSDMVATFLAVLELAKTKKLYLDGEGDAMRVELLAEDFENFSSQEWE